MLLQVLISLWSNRFVGPVSSGVVWGLMEIVFSSVVWVGGASEELVSFFLSFFLVSSVVLGGGLIEIVFSSVVWGGGARKELVFSVVLGGGLLEIVFSSVHY